MAIIISLKRVGLEQDFAVLKMVVILMSTWHEQPVRQIERLEQTSKLPKAGLPMV